MDYIGVVGSSYRTASLEELAAATLPADSHPDRLRELARLSGFSELVYLGTCNRVEFYFRGESRIHTKELLFHLRHSLADLTGGACQLPDDDKLYVEFGRAAVRHLFRVISALDSMMVGEAQINGQVKDAHQRAHDSGLLGGILDQTFHEAFHLAKRIRSETELARRPVSLVTLVERTIHDHLAGVVGAGAHPRRRRNGTPDPAAGPLLRPLPSGPDRQPHPQPCPGDGSRRPRRAVHRSRSHRRPSRRPPASWWPRPRPRSPCSTAPPWPPSAPRCPLPSRCS